MLILSFLFLNLAHYPAEASIKAPALVWIKVEEDKGVTIFERKEGDLLAFRTEGVVEAPLKDVAAALLDSEHTIDWVDHLEEDKVVRQTGPGQYLEYTHVGTPFVLKDRDFLCEVNIQVHEKEKELIIESHSVEDSSVPPTKFVRGHVAHNEFRLVAESPLRTKVVGEFHIDPKGTVPRWVVNMFQRAWPKKAFRAIQKRVASEKTELPKALAAVLAPIANF